MPIVSSKPVIDIKKILYTSDLGSFGYCYSYYSDPEGETSFCLENGNVLHIYTEDIKRSYEDEKTITIYVN